MIDKTIIISCMGLVCIAFGFALDLDLMEKIPLITIGFILFIGGALAATPLGQHLLDRQTEKDMEKETWF